MAHLVPHEEARWTFRREVKVTIYSSKLTIQWLLWLLPQSLNRFYEVRRRYDDCQCDIAQIYEADLMGVGHSSVSAERYEP